MSLMRQCQQLLHRCKKQSLILDFNIIKNDTMISKTSFRYRSLTLTINNHTMDSTTQLNLILKMTLTAWNAQNKFLSNLTDSLTDEQLQKEIAPGRNTGIYLLGHLIAVSDAMLPLLGFGDRLFPAMEEVFVKNPDKSGLEMPAIAELKQNLAAVNAKLSTAFESCTVDEWLSKHTAVSAEDFAKESHRNKLNVVISRTNHMANHIGQMILLK